ncbi:MAG: AAA family ATPase [Candidatus Poseidoniia archaeon]|nr:AAA family ATPase [Candidatus Poseidoniia archaeon]
MSKWNDFNDAEKFNISRDINSQNISTDEIRRQLFVRLPHVLYYLFPNGKICNNHFQVGDIQGNSGESLKIEMQGPKAGIWHDFATGEGGDIFDLWAIKRNFDIKNQFPKLVNDIHNWLGLYVPFQLKQQISTKKSLSNNDLGSPTGKWNYTDSKGNIIACIHRYDTSQGKQFRPWDVIAQKHKLPDSRPLYNQVGIARSDKVILVEGEKCAESLIKKGFCATTSMSGANAPINKTDWSPLKNKNIIIWPDNDDPGKLYAQKVQAKLLEIGIASLKIIDVPIDKPLGWDAADSVAEGLDVQSFLDTATITNDNSLKRINAVELIGIPPQRQWIIQDWLPRGCVTAIYGDGGVGKSLLVQQLMTAMATGKPWLGHINDPMKVYGLLCEDDEQELWRRQYSINTQLQLEMKDLENIAYVSRVGEDNMLMVFGDKDIGKLTDFFHQLLEDIQKFKPDLVVLDTAADLFGGHENNRTHVRQFIQNCCAKIARTVNAAVLLCAHPSDSGLQRKTGTGGSTAWNNTVRSRWYLEKPEEDETHPDIRLLSQKKSNYSSTKGKINIKWENGIFVETETNSINIMGAKHNNKIDTECKRKQDTILELINSQALKGSVYTMNQFCELFENQSGLGGKDAIRNRLDVLATEGYIKFFKDAENYGLQNPLRSKFGYLCVENMHLKTSKGEILILPSHFKSRETGAILPIESSKT